MRERFLKGFRTFAVNCLGYFPRPLAGPVSVLLGNLFMRLDKRGRRRGLANMARVGVGTDEHAREQLLRRMYHHLALTVLEILWNHRHLSRCLEHLEVVGKTDYDDALAQGRGILGISMHYGNWEYAGTAMGLLYPGTGTIVREQPDQGLDALLWQQRKAEGLVLFPNTKEQAGPMAEHVKKGHMLGILMDVYATREHPAVPFLGVPTPTFLGPAAQARDYDCPVFLIYDERLRPFHHRLHLVGPLPITWTEDRQADLLRVTAMFNEALSRRILEKPEQWLWIQKRWKENIGRASNDAP